jgi:regulator of replication initiation timing
MTPGRWLDGGDIGAPPFEEHVYIHEASLREAAREMLGWSSPSEVQALQRQVSELREECGVLALELSEMRKRWDALDVIESEGFRARKKPGRPPKEAVAS